MKKTLNKKVKRVLSFAIALAMLAGTLFTANVGININADAATEGRTVYLTDASTAKDTINNLSIDKFSKGSDGAYIIDTVEKLAYVCTKIPVGNTIGKTFKVDDGIDAFVLQTESYVTTAFGSLAALKAKSADELATAFDANETGLYNWMSTSGGCFSGNFDGNGVAIYGMYAKSTGRTETALFPSVDGCGTTAGTSSAVATDHETGSSFKNFAVRNSYIRGYRWIGAVIGTTQWYAGGAYCYGFETLDGVEVSNCYLFEDYTLTGANSAWATQGGCGIVSGAVSNDPIKAYNLLVYGNKTKRVGTDGAELETSTFTRLFSGNGATANVYLDNNSTKNENTTTVYGELHNSIILDATLGDSGLYKGAYTSNIYTNQAATGFSGINLVTDTDRLKGADGKTLMSALNWAKDGTETDTCWYAQENAYPTFIKPATDDWKNIKAYEVWDGTDATGFSGGDGTKENPYIITNAKELSLMITQGGGENAPKYYKVADGVTEIYLSCYAKTKDEIKAIGSAATNWVHGTTTFWGNFDGNGVTLYGMSTRATDAAYAGFVPEIGMGAVIKNVNFAAAYVESSQPVATVSGRVVAFTHNGNTTVNSYLSNISVTESYIHCTADATTYTTSHTATAGGIVAINTTPDPFYITNCLFDGGSSELVDSQKATAGVDPTSAKAGIITATEGSLNNVHITGCVSINEYLVPMVSAVAANSIPYDVTGYGGYRRYIKSDIANSVTMTDSYSVFNSDFATANQHGYTHDILTDGITDLAVKDAYTTADLVKLNWAKSWQLVTTESGRTIPMPTVSTSEMTGYESYSDMLSKHNNVGLKSGAAPNQNGNYGWTHELVGSGTEADPYIIDSAEKLAIAIATGGKSVNDKLYYKLACDIEIADLNWVADTVIGDEPYASYKYTAFEGVLDGDGHTVTGVSSVGENAGLVPELNGGTVKNIHLRGSYFGSTSTDGSAGAIVGRVTNGGTIEGCSAEDCLTLSNGKEGFALVGSGTATVKNSFAIAKDGTANTYYNANGAQVNADQITVDYSADVDKAVWYKTGNNLPRLVNFAKAHTYADIDGDGVAEVYAPADLDALSNYLVEKDGYENIYADVNHDGVTDIRDMAALCREWIKTYNKVSDGFWRNVELNNVKIYYDQNDTQDMARKMQLYLESIYPQNDIQKVAGTAVTDSGIDENTKANYVDEKNAIVIKKDYSADNYDKYSITYDKTNNVLTITGGSFTAVEQAVLDFIANSNSYSGNGDRSVYTVANASILDLTSTVSTNADGTTTATKAYKQAVTVGGETYYYVWSDEFDGTGTVSTDTWKTKPYRYQDSDTNYKGQYLNLKNGTVEALDDMWQVQDGKLTVWRGINTDSTSYSSLTMDTTWGYKPVANGNGGTVNSMGQKVNDADLYVDPGLIVTDNTMLFKQGYAEMRASLPSDGYSFPAWWFLGGDSSRNNNSLTQNLFGKVYKTNDDYNGASTMDASDLATYKYQIPKAYLEFDIVEFMEGAADPDYRDYIQLTIHKIYNQNRTFVKDDSGNITGYSLDLINWGTNAAGSTKTSTSYTGVNSNTDTFGNTASAAGDFIHQYLPSAQTSYYPYSKAKRTGTLYWGHTYSLVTDKDSSFSYTLGTNGITPNTISSDLKTFLDENGVEFSYNSTKSINSDHTLVQKYYNYGFAWTVDESKGTYSLTVYCDIDNDGIMQEDEKIFYVDQNVGHAASDDPTRTAGEDPSIWNQYMYMLIDNAYYTSLSGTANSQSNLLTKATGDKATFDIEYVRIYQLNNRRDVVTTETEAFNNGNHFGYGGK